MKKKPSTNLLVGETEVFAVVFWAGPGLTVGT